MHAFDGRHQSALLRVQSVSRAAFVTSRVAASAGGAVAAGALLLIAVAPAPGGSATTLRAWQLAHDQGVPCFAPLRCAPAPAVFLH